MNAKVGLARALGHLSSDVVHPSISRKFSHAAKMRMVPTTWWAQATTGTRQITRALVQDGLTRRCAHHASADSAKGLGERARSTAASAGQLCEKVVSRCSWTIAWAVEVGLLACWSARKPAGLRARRCDAHAARAMRASPPRSFAARHVTSHVSTHSTPSRGVLNIQFNLPGASLELRARLHFRREFRRPIWAGLPHQLSGLTARPRNHNAPISLHPRAATCRGPACAPTLPVPTPTNTPPIPTCDILHRRQQCKLVLTIF